MRTLLVGAVGMLALQALLVLGFVAVAERNRSVPRWVVGADLAILLVMMWVGVLVILPILSAEPLAARTRHHHALYSPECVEG